MCEHEGRVITLVNTATEATDPHDGERSRREFSTREAFASFMEAHGAPLRVYRYGGPRGEWRNGNLIYRWEVA